MCGKAPPYMPAFQPYRGKPVVRNDREGRGNDGIIRSPGSRLDSTRLRGVLGNERPYRDRREFITLLGGGAAAWPLAARAQQPKVPTIGVLVSGNPEPELLLKALRNGLRDLGYTEGRNIRLEIRTAEGRADLQRQDSQGQQAGRPAGRLSHQVRAGHQSQDRQGARDRNSADAAWPRRRGDRMRCRAFITLLGGVAVAWPVAAARVTMPSRECNVQE
jgi:hypothetical protein